MAKTHFSVTVEREDGPAVVVTVRRPTEDEAVTYWQHREDSQDPKRAAHGGHGDAAAEVLIGCVTSVVAKGVVAPTAPPPPDEALAAAPPPADATNDAVIPFIPAKPPGEAPAQETLLGGGSASDMFRVLREEYPHLPKQLAGRFLALAGNDLMIADAPASMVPEAVRKRAGSARLRALLVEPKPRLGEDGKPLKGPDGKTVLDGKLVVMTRLSASDVDFMEAEAATMERRTPSGAQHAAQARAHVVESPPGLLAEYPLLPLALGQLLYGAAAAKLGGAQGE